MLVTNFELKIYLLMVENICGKLKMFNLQFYLQ